MACRPPNGRAKAVALLDLRSGEGCSIVTLHGLQQLAILERLLPGLKSRLEPLGLQIELQIEDSCSSRSGARRGTLRALVATEQTCLHPPLILGFLGNERKESFEASYGITKSFDIPYILPYSIGSELNTKENVYFISSYPLLQHTKAMKLLLIEMGLSRGILAYEDSEFPKLKAEHMMRTLKNSFCFVRSFSFSDAGGFRQQISTDSDGEVLLVILENNSLIEGISKILRQYEKEIIISVGKIGLYYPFLTAPREVYILEMASKARYDNLTSSYDKEMLEAYEKYILKNCLEINSGQERICKGLLNQKKETDWSLGPLAKGLETIGMVGERAASCGLDCKKSWLSKVERSEFAPAFSVYLAHNFSILKVGRIDGESLLAEKDLRGGRRPAVNGKCEVTLLTTLPPPTSTTGSPAFSEDVFDELGTYQLVGVATGAATGALLLVGLVLCLLYRTVRSDRSDSSASIRTALSD